MPIGRTPLKFSLRTLLVAFTVFVLWLGLLVHRAQQQKAAIAAIEAVDGYWYYDYQFEPPDGYFGDRATPGPAWIWNLVDPNLAFNVVAVGLNSKPATNDTVRLVSRLRKLQVLDLAAADEVTDEGLKQLESLPQMIYLRLDGTSVTEAAIAHYQQVNPAVDVVR
jgi:hypothetical protein